MTPEALKVSNYKIDKIEYVFLCSLYPYKKNKVSYTPETNLSNKKSVVVGVSKAMSWQWQESHMKAGSGILEQSRAQNSIFSSPDCPVSKGIF